MKKSKEMSKLIFHVLDKKIIILFFIFIIAFANIVYSEGSLEDEDLKGFQPSANYGGDGSFNIIFSGFLLKEGEDSPIHLLGDIEKIKNEKNEDKYFVSIRYDTIIVRTYYTTPLTESDTRYYIGQTDKIVVEPVEVFEMEIEFIEQFPLARLLKVHNPDWSWYIIDGILFFKTLDNGQKKFTIKLENVRRNG